MWKQQLHAAQALAGEIKQNGREGLQGEEVCGPHWFQQGLCCRFHLRAGQESRLELADGSLFADGVPTRSMEELLLWRLLSQVDKDGEGRTALHDSLAVLDAG